MDNGAKLELLAAIVETRERTKLGLQTYYAMRDRATMLDYDMRSKNERAAVNIFYEDIENQNLGRMMEKTTANAEELFQHVEEMCAQSGLSELDEEFETVMERFVALLDAWKPLSDACSKIAERALKELGSIDDA